MSDYRILETDEFRRRLCKLPVGEGEWIRRKMAALVYPQLRRAPHVGPHIRKLRGCSPETWRYRIGRFRMFYSVDENEHIVFLLTLDHRKDAYR